MKVSTSISKRLQKRAHRVAWGAVEKEYHKDLSGRWVKNG